MSLETDRNRLLRMLRSLSFERHKVTLSSGKESDFYIDCKRVTLLAEGHALVGRLLFDRIRRLRPIPRAVGGLTLGADPIASAIAYTSFLEYSQWHGINASIEQPDLALIDSFVVRKDPKGYGTGQWIEGCKNFPVDSHVVVIEDVITSGGSALKAIEKCRIEKLHVVGCFALVDRLEGGREAIEALGIPVESLFTCKDFMEIAMPDHSDEEIEEKV